MTSYKRWIRAGSGGRKMLKWELDMSPQAAPRPCPVPGCPSLVTRTQSCPKHPRRPFQTPRSLQGSTRRWRRRRLQVLMRNPLCVDCQAEGRVTAATEVDHIVPVSQGGTDDDDNLAGRCHAHHHAKTVRERRRAGNHPT